MVKRTATLETKEDSLLPQDLEQQKVASWQDQLPASERGALETEGWGRLSETQVAVMRDSKRRAKEASDAAMPRLKKRFTKLGFNEKHLTSVLRYIAEEAPIVIHFNPDRRMGWLSNRTVLEAFLSDTHYRNKYETGVSGGFPPWGRDTKERELFAGLYHRAPDSDSGAGSDSGSGSGSGSGFGFRQPPAWERPKYGALNGLRRGGSAVYGSFFGSCHFRLQDDVRKRCTFGYGVTSDEPKQTPGTCEHFAHILERCDDNQLRCLVEIAKGTVGRPSDSRLNVEAQIHGPIEFKKDIEEVRFPAYKPLKTWKRLQNLGEANGFAVRIY